MGCLQPNQAPIEEQNQGVVGKAEVNLLKKELRNEFDNVNQAIINYSDPPWLRVTNIISNLIQFLVLPILSLIGMIQWIKYKSYKELKRNGNSVHSTDVHSVHSPSLFDTQIKQ